MDQGPPHKARHIKTTRKKLGKSLENTGIGESLWNVNKEYRINNLKNLHGIGTVTGTEINGTGLKIQK